MLELAKDAISKCLIILKVLFKRIYEFLLRYQIPSLKMTLFLMPLLNHHPIKKKTVKKTQFNLLIQTVLK